LSDALESLQGNGCSDVTETDGDFRNQTAWKNLRSIVVAGRQKCRSERVTRGARRATRMALVDAGREIGAFAFLQSVERFIPDRAAAPFSTSYPEPSLTRGAHAGALPAFSRLASMSKVIHPVIRHEQEGCDQAQVNHELGRRSRHVRP
jgi:hypothetical protein